MTKKYSMGEEKEKTSLLINKNYMKALRYISFTEEKTQTDIINESIGAYIEKYEKKNGEIPEKHK